MESETTSVEWEWPEYDRDMDIDEPERAGERRNLYGRREEELLANSLPSWWAHLQPTTRKQHTGAMALQLHHGLSCHTITVPNIRGIYIERSPPPAEGRANVEGFCALEKAYIMALMGYRRLVL